MNDIWTKSLTPNILDLVVIIFYMAIIFVIAKAVERQNVDKNRIYEYFVGGLFFKIFCGIIFCLIYQFYYHEQGDTVMYYRSSEAFVNLMHKNFYRFFLLFCGDQSWESYSYFGDDTGVPIYFNQDNQTFAAIRFFSVFTWLGFRNYYTTTVLVATFSYLGEWKLYILFNKLNPKLYKQLAFSILFIPSVAFWGSAILKDSFTFSAACWYTYCFYNVFINRNKVFSNAFGILLSCYILISIKPYIFLALMPGSFIWLSFNRIKNIKSQFIKILIGPFIVVFGLFAISFVLKGVSDKMGSYSNVKGIVEKAQSTQKDLIRGEQYGNNYYDIGEFDGSFSSMASKAPLAITAGLFRPFLWDARNPVMLISALENSAILGFVIFILFKVGPVRLVTIITAEPILIFSFFFAIFFAFAVGLTTANFGALVRYRIPAIPFFVSGLVIMRDRLSYIFEKRNYVPKR